MKNMRRNSTGQAGDDEALEAGQGEAADLVQQLAKDMSNVVFMDIDIPGLTPAEAANILKAAYPEINVLLFSLHGAEKTSTQITSGKINVTPPSSLTEFFTYVYDATMHTNRQTVQKVFAFFNRKANTENDPYGLSPRELEVLDCLVNGDTYKMIAEHCHISVGTVRSHIMNIYRKLDVNSRSGAIVKAMHEKLVRS